jgi:hypothetical protein
MAQGVNMDNLVVIGAAAAIGLLLGYGIARLTSAKPVAKAANGAPDWWAVRKTLTGTQLQILQHMEAQKRASITQLQEKFEYIPDRELYYRLEQIALLQFIARGRDQGDVVYTLNPAYSGTVEDDKTVMLSS